MPFPYFVIGVAKFLDGERQSPQLRYALNLLAATDWFQPPLTTQGLLALCNRPINEWWRGEPLPEQIDPDEALIVRGRLSESAENYLAALSEDGNHRDTIAAIASFEVNNRFRRLFQQLRAAYVTDIETAQSEYIQLRRFLIRNPFTDKRTLRRTFRHKKYLTPQAVRQLYADAVELAPLLHDPENDCFYNCQRCGAVQRVDGVLQGVNAAVCEMACPRWEDGWQPVAPDDTLLVLHEAVQRRILIPGVPELALHDALLQIHQQQPDQMAQPVLWPGVDAYDLLLPFADGEMWVVDVKDRGAAFGRNLPDISSHPLIRWQRAFYVYPDARTQQPHYRATLRRDVRLHWTELVSHSDFLKFVQQKLEG